MSLKEDLICLMYALKILLNFSITEFLAKVRFEVKLILIMNVFQMFLFG